MSSPKCQSKNGLHNWKSHRTSLLSLSTELKCSSCNLEASISKSGLIRYVLEGKYVDGMLQVPEIQKGVSESKTKHWP